MTGFFNNKTKVIIELYISNLHLEANSDFLYFYLTETEILFILLNIFNSKSNL